MANTQTTVPLFVANTILTANQQNLSAGTGVPVFATTVTRDAAFGGSNKALAEGQLCYIEASNIVQYYDGAAWATVGPTTSKIAQVINTAYTTATSTTSATYVTTGATATITPTLNTSKILVIASTSIQNSGTGTAVRATMFRGTVAGTNLAGGATVQAGGYVYGANNLISTPSMNFLDSPATTSATTYTLGFATGNSSVTATAQVDTTSALITLMEVLA